MTMENTHGYVPYLDLDGKVDLTDIANIAMASAKYNDVVLKNDLPESSITGEVARKLTSLTEMLVDDYLRVSQGGDRPL